MHWTTRKAINGHTVHFCLPIRSKNHDYQSRPWVKRTKSHYYHHPHRVTIPWCKYKSTPSPAWRFPYQIANILMGPSDYTVTGQTPWKRYRHHGGRRETTFLPIYITLQQEQQLVDGYESRTIHKCWTISNRSSFMNFRGVARSLESSTILHDWKYFLLIVRLVLYLKAVLFPHLSDFRCHFVIVDL